MGDGDPEATRIQLERLRRRDPAAFEALVREQGPELYRLARRFLPAHEDADEVVQETFIRAWRGLARFRGDASLRTWLIRIAINVARSARSRRREAEPPGEPEQVADPGEGADEAARRRETADRVRQAVAELPPRQREVVVLKVFSGLTYREVADVMELTEGAVKAHFHQAVSNLRRRMGGG